MSVKDTIRGQKAHKQSRVAREPIQLHERVALSPSEFAALNGRSASWAYRLLYRGIIKAISDCGRLLIPRSEVESFIARATRYNPRRNEGGGE